MGTPWTEVTTSNCSLLLRPLRLHGRQYLVEHGLRADGVDGRIAVLQARQLNQDAVFALSLDRGFRDAQGVNPVADYFESL